MRTSREIADWILSRINTVAGDTISPLKLQKLLYYCQAWHLAIFDEALFEEEIEAWAHGPVVPSQYSRFADILRTDSIDIADSELKTTKLTKETEDLLNEVIEIYGEHSASYLENLTHSESPWIDARKDLKSWERSNNVISKESMREFYVRLNSGE